MNTHYLFLNKQFQEYVEDDNDILIEGDIVKAISFNEVVSGTTSMLIDAAIIFGNRDLKEINFKSEM